jgi:hypothetical protein
VNSIELILPSLLKISFQKKAEKSISSAGCCLPESKATPSARSHHPLCHRRVPPVAYIQRRERERVFERATKIKREHYFSLGFEQVARKGNKAWGGWTWCSVNYSHQGIRR